MVDISLSNSVPFSPIAAVRNCPSGALSYAIGGVECRDEVDQVRERDDCGLQRRAISDHWLYLLTEMHHNVCLLSMTLREKGPAVSTQHHKVIEDERGTSRLEAFSDGVMAVAITLLVLDLRVPDVKAGLFEALLRQWPIYLGYVTSFLVIGILWLHHHHIFKYIKRTDHVVLFLNLLMLMCVALIPFVTALLTRRYLIAPLLYLFSLPLTLVNVEACLVLYILVALFYALPADRLQVEQRNDTSQERINCTS